jgi:hypothetical protein
VKSEPKPFASLSSGLLARKGAARPAMRPQGFGGQTGAGLEDLGWNDMGFEAPKPVIAPRDEAHDAFGEEVLPHPVRNPATGLTPIHSPVHDQHAEIADRFGASDADEEFADEEFADETAVPFEAPVAEFEAPIVEEARAPLLATRKPSAPAPAPAPRRAPQPRSAPGSKGKAAFTLRLDPDRHLKLRLACAVSSRSAQMLVIEALDGLLGQMPELEAMVEKAKRKG